MDYKSNNNVVYSCKYHVIWCVKYRRKIIDTDIENRLKKIVFDICQERNAELIEIECDKDHVHVLVEVDPQYGIHKLVKQMKGRTSRLLRQDFRILRTRLPIHYTYTGVDGDDEDIEITTEVSGTYTKTVSDKLVLCAAHHNLIFEDEIVDSGLVDLFTVPLWYNPSIACERLLLEELGVLASL